MIFGIGRKNNPSPELLAIEREAEFLQKEIEALNRRKSEIEQALASYGVYRAFQRGVDRSEHGGQGFASLSTLLVALLLSGCASSDGMPQQAADFGVGSLESEAEAGPPLERPRREKNLFSEIADSLPTQSVNAVECAYQRGQADEIKRLYFARNNIERSKEHDTTGSMVYYTFPGPSQTVDGARLVPHEVTVPILE